MCVNLGLDPGKLDRRDSFIDRWNKRARTETPRRAVQSPRRAVADQTLKPAPEVRILKWSVKRRPRDVLEPLEYAQTRSPIGREPPDGRAGVAQSCTATVPARRRSGANDPRVETQLQISSGCTHIRRSIRPYFASMIRPQFKRSIARTPRCRSRRDGQATWL
jgi:hypothetical protein